MGCCISTPTEQITSVPKAINFKKCERKSEIQQSLAILTSQRLFIGNVHPRIQSLCKQYQERQKNTMPEIERCPVPKVEQQKPEQQTTKETKSVQLPKEPTHRIKIEEKEHHQQTKNEIKSNRKASLHQIWDYYATNECKTKMNMESLTSALREFGIQIDDDLNLQKLVFDAFDSEQNGEWIDYNDFEKTISFIHYHSLLLLFQIFDKNKDGFLEVADIANIIFSMYCIDSMTMHSEIVKNLSNNQCLQIAWNMVQKHIKSDYSPNSPLTIESTLNISSVPYSPNSPCSTGSSLNVPNSPNSANSEYSNIGDIKISFNQFKSMMMDESNNDMIEQHKYKEIGLNANA